MPERTIRVVLLTTSFPLRPGSVSGIFVQRLATSLPATVTATVVTPCDTSPVTTANGYILQCFRYAPWEWQLLAHQPGGIPVALKQSNALRCLLPAFLGAMLLACFRAAIKADIIHANWSVNGALAGIVGRLVGKPVITTLRGEDVTRAADSRLYRYLLVWCLRSNYCLVAVSEAIHQLLVSKFPRYAHKVSFLPNGVDRGLLQNAPVMGHAVDSAANKGNRHTGFRLLAIGSLIPRKGIDTLIEALTVTPEGSQFRLSIVGAGPELGRLQNLVRQRRLEDRVIFIGAVAPEKIADFLAAADALVLASYSEGRPNVVLEAFAAGVPVIASDIDGVREMITSGETGLLFKPGDARMLAGRLVELQQSEQLQRQFSRQGREFILKHQLLWPVVGQRYADLYQQAIRVRS